MSPVIFSGRRFDNGSASVAKIPCNRVAEISHARYRILVQYNPSLPCCKTNSRQCEYLSEEEVRSFKRLSALGRRSGVVAWRCAQRKVYELSGIWIGRQSVRIDVSLSCCYQIPRLQPLTFTKSREQVSWIISHSCYISFRNCRSLLVLEIVVDLAVQRPRCCQE